MATKLVFKVRDSIGVLVASCRSLSDACVIAARHGAGTKISHMHFGVLATVSSGDHSGVAAMNCAHHKLTEKREAMRQEYERTLQAEAERRAQREAAHD